MLTIAWKATIGMEILSHLRTILSKILNIQMLRKYGIWILILYGKLEETIKLIKNDK